MESFASHARLICWLIALGLAGAGLLGAAPARWEERAGHRAMAITLPSGKGEGFTRMDAAQTGIHFANVLAESRHLTNQILLDGSGVALGDVDGDGWCDLLLCHIDGANALYRNLGGWRFENIAAAAGVEAVGWNSTGAALADLDGDGDLDLVLNGLGRGTSIFYNDGQGKFRPGPVLNAGSAATGIALGDFDGDGFLDLYVVNYRFNALMDMPDARATFRNVGGRLAIETINGRPITSPDLTNRFFINARGAVDEMGEADCLYRSQGGTNFVAAPFSGGAFLDEDGEPLKGELFEWGLNALFRDFNHDGLPDLFVSNDFESPDRLWINQGRGKFRLAPRETFRQTSYFSMGADVADVNRDGWDDLFVLDMLPRNHRDRMAQSAVPHVIGAPGDLLGRPQYSISALHFSRGDGTFAQNAFMAGLADSDWAWGAAFLDVDLDGWEDLLVTNGNERDGRNMDTTEQLKALRAGKRLTRQQMLEQRRLFSRLNVPNLAYRNLRDGSFEEVGSSWGFNHDGVSHGLALADLDNDGDLDVVVNNMNETASVYRNNSSAPRLWVAAKGEGGNTRGVGARVVVRKGPVEQSQEIMAGGRYVSSDEPARVFAAGEADGLDVEVVWPDGRRTFLSGVAPNQRIEVSQAGALRAEEEKPRGKLARPIFEDVSGRLGHTHHEVIFDDFAAQPLLPWRASQEGPGLAWWDWDGDGWDDLVIGSGKGGRIAAMLNNHSGGFAPDRLPAARLMATRDVAGFAAGAADGERQLFAAFSNYEDGLGAGVAVKSYRQSGGPPTDEMAQGPDSLGPIAMADIDGDGDLDLFAGGRVVSGAYGQPASSSLWVREGGRWLAHPDTAERFHRLGMVSGALFTDLNNDGWPDLVVTLEWGSPRIFINQRGRFEDVSEAWGVAQLRGPWLSVASGDLDGDGRVDLVLGNVGMNTPWQPHLANPLWVRFAASSGGLPALFFEAVKSRGVEYPVPFQNLEILAASMPTLREKYRSHADFSKASAEAVASAAGAQWTMVEANSFKTTLLLNRGGRFEAASLPQAVHTSPTFAIAVADFDLDGWPDLFLAQNFFAVRPNSSRMDAGLGLLMLNQGGAGFRTLDVRESGIRILGEQRGVAVGDFDKDGRPDLAVGQNGAETKLYRGIAAKPGQALRLKGGAGNPDAVGARVWLAGEDGKPRLYWEAQSGGGHLSQHSLTVILPATAAGAGFVEWPGGGRTPLPAAAGSRELLLSSPASKQPAR